MKRKWLAYVLAGTMTLTNITPMAMPAAAAEVSVEDTVVADEETPLLDEEVLEAADEAADEDFTAALPEAEDGEAELIDEEQLFGDEDLQDGLEAVFEEDQIAEPETDWSFIEEVVTDDEEEAADEQVVAEGGLELGDFTREFHVNPGDSVTLSLPNVTSDNDITYRWYEYDPAYEVIDGAVSSSFTVDNVQKNMEFECLVMSGSDSTWAHFYIYIDNDLSVQRVGGYDRYVDYGSDVTLKVKVESKYGNLTYRWYDSTEGDNVLQGIDCSEYTLSGVEKTHHIYCYVSDPYGNSSSTSFYIF